MGDDSLSNDEMVDTIDSAESFDAAYRAHSGAVYKFLFWRTNDARLSEDLTSTTFEKAWTARHRFHYGTSKAWFYAIARNVLIDHWRKHKDLPLDDAELVHDDADSPAEIVDAKLRAEQLQAALKKLPASMRQVVTLRFIEGRSCRQVAEELDMSEGNVRIIQYRALQKLKGYLHE